MSSLLFLGFSVIAFVMSYGIMFTLVPQILGVFFTASDSLVPNLSPEWQTSYEETETQTRFLVPLVPTIGIMILVVKVLMIASAKGRD